MVFDARNDIIKGFKSRLFPMMYRETKGDEKVEEDEEEDEEPDLSWTYEPYNKIEKLIDKNIVVIKKIKNSKNTSYVKPYATKLQTFM